jgi:phage baseplate assembly protein gpV
MSWGLSSRAVSSILALLAAGSVVRAQEHSESAPSASEGRPSHQTTVGTLMAYDPVTSLLTACNAAGSSDFHVAADARIWLGNRRLLIAQLGAHAGAQVTVTWSEAEGERTTHTVRVTDTRPAHAR